MLLALPALLLPLPLLPEDPSRTWDEGRGMRAEGVRRQSGNFREMSAAGNARKKRQKTGKADTHEYSQEDADDKAKTQVLDVSILGHPQSMHEEH